VFIRGIHTMATDASDVLTSGDGHKRIRDRRHGARPD
jgi:hypothetical protein